MDLCLIRVEEEIHIETGLQQNGFAQTAPDEGGNFLMTFRSSSS